MISLFKKPKYRNFDYKPRFYNQEKDDLERRLGQYKKDQSNNLEFYKESIKTGIRSNYRRDPALKKKLARTSNIRLIIIIAILVVLSLVFLESDSLKTFLEFFSNTNPRD